MNAQEIYQLVQGEIARRGRLQSAIEALQKQLAIIDERITAWSNIASLQQAEIELQGPIAEVLQLLSANGDQATSGEEAEEDDEAGADGGGSGISRTLGKRIYANVAAYLNKPGREMAPVQQLYDMLPPELRAEIEAVPSSKEPLFRFRRLLRRNKEDFAVDRFTGVVTYLHYAPTADYFPTTRPPSVPGFAEKTSPVILGKRFDASHGWLYQFRNPNKEEIFIGGADRFFTYFDKFADGIIKLRRSDGTMIGVARVGTGEDARLVSYDGETWTTDLDYGLKSYTGS